MQVYMFRVFPAIEQHVFFLKGHENVIENLIFYLFGRSIYGCE